MKLKFGRILEETEPPKTKEQLQRELGDLRGLIDGVEHSENFTTNRKGYKELRIKAEILERQIARL